MSDRALHEQLLQEKDRFSKYGKTVFREARDRANPFESIGNGPFMNRAAVKLANIDALYKVMGEQYTLFNQTSDKMLTFLDLCGGPGGFTQYLMYRMPGSFGKGITLKGNRGFDWNLKGIKGNFTPLFGSDQTGNLHTNWRWVLAQQSPESIGYDLVVADGGFDTEERPELQEVLSSYLIFTEAVVGMTMARFDGGNFVLKMFDTVTTISAQTIYLLACVFEEINMIKPISSRPANSERYLVCKNKRSSYDTNRYVRYALEALKKWDQVQPLQDNIRLVYSLWSEEVDALFSSWLHTINRLLDEEQLKYVDRLNRVLEGKEVDDWEYDARLALPVWHL